MVVYPFGFLRYGGNREPPWKTVLEGNNEEFSAPLFHGNADSKFKERGVPFCGQEMRENRGADRIERTESRG